MRRPVESNPAAESSGPTLRAVGTRSIESSRAVSTVAHPARILTRMLERRQLALTRLYLRQLRDR